MTPLARRIATLRSRLVGAGATEIIEWGPDDGQHRLAEYGRCPCGDIYRQRTTATQIGGQIHVASECVCPSCGAKMQYARDWSRARKRATGPRGILIEQISLNGRPTLRVTMRGALIGRGHYTSVPEALAALQLWGIDPDDLVFEYDTPASPHGEDPECE
jgi:hypothetical protein